MLFALLALLAAAAAATELHEAAAAGDVAKIEELVAAGASLEAKTEGDALTPMHVAAGQGVFLPRGLRVKWARRPVPSGALSHGLSNHRAPVPCQGGSRRTQRLGNSVVGTPSRPQGRRHSI